MVATDPQPTPVPLTWADDPTEADRYSVLPDDELFRFLPVGTENSNYLYDFDSNGNSHEVAANFALPVPATYSDATESYLDPTTEFAAGRIVSNEAEQLVAVTKTALGAKGGCQSSQTFTVGGAMAPAGEVSHPVPDTYPTSFPSFTFDACQDQSFSNGTRGRDRWPGSPYAVAAGDLDWQVDDNGDLHDEVAIAYERANLLHVRVLNYSVPGRVISSNDHGTGLTIGYAAAAGTNTFECLDQGGAAQACNTLPGQVRAAIFNPDSSAEDRRAYIATFSTGPGAYSLRVFDYAPGEPGEPGTVSGLHQMQWSRQNAYSSAIGLVAGDFDDDGRDELAITYVQGNNEDDGNRHLTVVRYNPDDGTFDAIADKVVVGEGDNRSQVAANRCDGSTCYYWPGELAAGLFAAPLPTDSATLSRKQIAVLFTPKEPHHAWSGFHLAVYSLVGNQLLSTPSGIFGSSHNPTIVRNPGDTFPGSAQLAGGNWLGVNAPPDNPAWGLAIGDQATPTEMTQYLEILPQVIDKASGPTLTPATTEHSSFRLQAFDYDGDSYYLGAPVVFTSESVNQLLAEVQEPPKHLDYLPGSATDDSGILNISRVEGFETEFAQSSSEEDTSTNKETFSWSTGGSEDLSASLTARFGIPLIAKVKTTDTLEEQFDYNYEHSTSDSKATSTSLEVSMSGSAVDDDALHLATEEMQIWRYRLYGPQPTDPDDPPYTYHEVHIPLGATSEWTPGSQDDEYQPLHENGNVLSYPQISQTIPSYTPPDNGEWFPPNGCTIATGPQLSPFNEPTKITLGGIAQTYDVSYDETSTCESERESSNSLTEELSYKNKTKFKLNEVFAAEKAEIDFDLTFTATQSWSSLSSFENVYKNAASFGVKTVTIDNHFGYSIFPKLYVAQSGNLKLAFATEADGADTIWLDGIDFGYFNADPALNLPNKFVESGGAWQVSTYAEANKIRGFFIRDAEQEDDTTGLGPLVDASPAYGAQVQLEARIYNYSSRSSVDSIPVRFDIADYDSASKTASNRRTLGTVMAQYTDEANNPDGAPRPQPLIFPPRGIGRAVYTLDTSTLPTPEGADEYQVFVVIDPENDIEDETHDWRQPNVIVFPYSTGAVGALLALEFRDELDNVVGAARVISQGNIAADIQCLALAFSNDPGSYSGCTIVENDDGLLTGKQIHDTYNIIATANPVPSPQVVPIRLILSSLGANSVPDGVLPPSDVYDAALAFQSAKNGTNLLSVIPSVGNPSGKHASMTATNLDDGQNNEGWGLLTVVAASEQTEEPAPAEDASPDLFLRQDSLSARGLEGTFESSHLTAEVGTPVEVRACGYSRALYRDETRISLYSGNPTEGHGLARKTLPAINGEDGTCTWALWTPREAGYYTLSAVLEEPGSDALKTNNHTSVEVEVLDR